MTTITGNEPYYPSQVYEGIMYNPGVTLRQEALLRFMEALIKNNWYKNNYDECAEEAERLTTAYLNQLNNTTTMSTPQDKAKELVQKYYDLTDHMQWEDAKQCALIAVEEILKAIPMYTGNLNPTWKFYDEVKTEIQNL